MEKLIGIIPAGGLGSRLRQYPIPKELFPLGFEDSENGLKPKSVIEYSFDLMRIAGIKNVFIVINSHKFEILKYVQDGANFHLNVSYLVQPNANGMCQAIDLAFPWLNTEITCFLMPDTIVRPVESMKCIIEKLQKGNSDVVLGIFPTETPQNLGPVRYIANNSSLEILEIFDKPSDTKLMNTWGIACWKSSFSLFLHDFIKDKTDLNEIPLGEVFQKAINSNLKVEGVLFNDSDSVYKDIGTLKGLKETFDYLNFF